jgi:hypothetical protein
MLGYDHAFVNAVYDLSQSIAHGRACVPDFRDGAQCVAVLEAVDNSIESGSWSAVEKVE